MKKIQGISQTELWYVVIILNNIATHIFVHKYTYSLNVLLEINGLTRFKDMDLKFSKTFFFFNLFIFGCVGSSSLRTGFL